MLFQSLLLSLLTTAANPTSSATTDAFAEDYAPPAVQLPCPLYTTHSSDEGLFMVGGYHSGSSGGLCWGYGWTFSDGRNLSVCWGPRMHGLEIVSRTIFHETEDARCSLICGTRNGLRYECYVGYGLAARVDFSCSIKPLRLVLDWYPVEGIVLSLGIDPLLRCWQFEWCSNYDSPL